MAGGHRGRLPDVDVPRDTGAGARRARDEHEHVGAPGRPARTCGCWRRAACGFVDPGEGFLACGWTGKGRLAEPAEIVAAAEAISAAVADARRAPRGRVGGPDLRGHRSGSLRREPVERAHGIRAGGRSGARGAERDARCRARRPRGAARRRDGARAARRRDARCDCAPALRGGRRHHGRRRGGLHARARSAEDQRRIAQRADADAHADARHPGGTRPAARRGSPRGGAGRLRGGNRQVVGGRGRSGRASRWT